MNPFKLPDSSVLSRHDTDFLSLTILPLAFTILLCLVGCSGSEPKAKIKGKSSGSGLKPKLTTEIGEFKAEDGKVELDSKVKYSNPITGPLEAFDPVKQQISEGEVVRAVEMFRATEGRYPKDYAEFKSKVIDEYGLRLPTLGVGKRYEYDVANHKLIVVMEKK